MISKPTNLQRMFAVTPKKGTDIQPIRTVVVDAPAQLNSTAYESLVAQTLRAAKVAEQQELERAAAEARAEQEAENQKANDCWQPLLVETIRG